MNLLHSFKQSAISLMMNLPPSIQIKISGGALIRKEGRTLDLQTQVLIAVSKYVPGFSGKPPVIARKMFAESVSLLVRRPVGLPKIEDKTIPVSGGSIRVRIYNPNPEERSQPALVYYHGGGHVVGSIETHDALCRKIAYRTNCMVFSVDYRLAPEHPFPIPLEDCHTAYKWVLSEAKLFGVDTKRIAIGGDSAGGQLAIAVILKLIQQKEPKPLVAWLFYPMTDVSKESASYETFASGYILERSGMRWYIQHHTPQTVDRMNSFASPLLADSLKGFPETYIQTAGFDVLRDEGKAFADRLQESKIKVTYSEQSGLIHGYVSMGEWIEEAEKALDEAILYLRNLFQSIK